MQKYKLAERAVLMRLSVGLPGKNRKDRQLTENVKSEHSLGRRAGSWIKQKYPDWALEPLEKLVNEARAYHSEVTLVFDAGIGILPGPLIMDYGDKMREFKGRFDNLRDSHFRVKYPEMIDWAKVEHNGTFEADDYPPVEDLMDSFYFKTEPLPVPDAGHFERTMKSLLGVDAEGIDVRVQDAMEEAQKELMRRLIEPVRAMASKLAEPQKEGKDCPVFRDTLVGNIRQIVKLAPKLNIAGDPQIDAFVKEVKSSLALVEPAILRADVGARSAVARTADEIAKRMAAYSL